MRRLAIGRRAAIVALALITAAAEARPPARSPPPPARALDGGQAGARAVPGDLAASPRPPDRTALVGNAARHGSGTEDFAHPAQPAGALCGDASLRGAALPEIAGRLDGCGVADPVRLSHVDGVALSQPAMVDCVTARALSAWVRQAVRPAVGARGGGLSALRVVAHYTCRTRNNRPGAKVSEHGKGRAIDIAALALADGSEIAVLDGWRDPQDHPLLKRLHAAACGPFGTVLGPDSDRHHRDHFHLDTARNRTSPYCR